MEGCIRTPRHPAANPGDFRAQESPEQTGSGLIPRERTGGGGGTHRPRCPALPARQRTVEHGNDAQRARRAGPRSGCTV